MPQKIPGAWGQSPQDAYLGERLIFKKMVRVAAL